MSDQDSDRRIVDVYKAQSVEGRDAIPTTSISIGGCGEFPRIVDRDQSDLVRDADARAIVTALRESLPGGTFDRVAGLLVLATATRLTIPILDAPYLATVAPAVRRGLGRAQQLLSTVAVERGDPERAESRAALVWLEDQLWGGRISGLIVEEDPRPDGEAPGGAGTASSTSTSTGFMTWRDLNARLRELDMEGPAADQEIVIRIEDDEVSHCGGLQSIDVETGCAEEPALVFDASCASPCADVTNFADGALSKPRSATFRRHLRSCASCMVKLAEALQLSAQLSDADTSRRARLLEAGVADVDCALLETFVREHRRSGSPDLVLRATSIAAALSALSGGPRISTEVAGILIMLLRRWMAEVIPSPFLASLCALMASLGLDVGDWTGRHCPSVAGSEASPGVRIAGCSCGWSVPTDASDPVEAFDLHVGEMLGDEMAASHEEEAGS